MGLPRDLFLQPVDDELICAVCMDVLDNPASACSESHMFCKACLETCVQADNRCPLDRKKLASELRLVRPVGNMIGKLAMRCPQHEAGCAWTGSASEHAQHSDQACLFVRVPCEFAHIGCSERPLRHAMAEHHAACVHQHMMLMAARISGQDATIARQQMAIAKQATELADFRNSLRETEIRFEWPTYVAGMLKALKGSGNCFESEVRHIDGCGVYLSIVCSGDDQEDSIFVSVQWENRAKIPGFATRDWRLHVPDGLLGRNTTLEQNGRDSAILGTVQEVKHLNFFTIVWEGTSKRHHASTTIEFADRNLSELGRLQSSVDEVRTIRVQWRTRAATVLKAFEDVDDACFMESSRAHVDGFEFHLDFYNDSDAIYITNNSPCSVETTACRMRDTVGGEPILALDVDVDVCWLKLGTAEQFKALLRDKEYLIIEWEGIRKNTLPDNQITLLDLVDGEQSKRDRRLQRLEERVEQLQDEDQQKQHGQKRQRR